MSQASYDKTKANELLSEAKRLHEQGANWMQLSNALFGIGGPCAKAFPEQSQRQAFLEGPEYAKIRQIMLSLPMPHETEGPGDGPSGKFMVRVPRSLHAALQAEAEAEGVSLNQLVVAKLSVSLGDRANQRAGVRDDAA